MIRDFKTESCTLEVSKIGNQGLWLGNTTEHVAKGTALGDEFTETLYTPSSEGFTATYGEGTHTWSELEDKTDWEYYSPTGETLTIGSPLGDYPEGAILEKPPTLEEYQKVKYDGSSWVIYECHKGKSYWDKNCEEFTVGDDYFELPDECTWSEPLEHLDGFKVILVNGVWEYIEDYVGLTAYNTSTKLPTVITELGELPEGFTLLVPDTYSKWEYGAWVLDEEAYNISLLEMLDSDAKSLRDETTSSDLEVEGLDNSVFQCTNEARDIKDIIFEAEAEGALEEDTVDFRLADNSWKVLSLTDLRLVLSTFISRKREVWVQFATWDQGDKSVPFEVVFEQPIEDEITS